MPFSYIFLWVDNQWGPQNMSAMSPTTAAVFQQAQQDEQQAILKQGCELGYSAYVGWGQAWEGGRIKK